MLTDQKCPHLHSATPIPQSTHATNSLLTEGDQQRHRKRENDENRDRQLALLFFHIYLFWVFIVCTQWRVTDKEAEERISAFMIFLIKDNSGLLEMVLF